MTYDKCENMTLHFEGTELKTCRGVLSHSHIRFVRYRETTVDAVDFTETRDRNGCILIFAPRDIQLIKVVEPHQGQLPTGRSRYDQEMVFRVPCSVRFPLLETPQQSTRCVKLSTCPYCCRRRVRARY